jgi:hypothetical protein
MASQAARKCSKVDMDEPNIIMFITSFGKRTERRQMMRIPITTTSITRSLMVSAIRDLKHFIHLLLSALPTNKNGAFVSKYAEPEPWVLPDATPENPWHPFDSRLWFDFVHHQFVHLQTSENNTDISLDLLKAAVIGANGNLKFSWLSTKKMYETIDQIQAGLAPFRSYYFQYNGPMPPTPPKWMTQTYELYAQDPQLVLQQQLATP